MENRKFTVLDIVGIVVLSLLSLGTVGIYCYQDITVYQSVGQIIIDLVPFILVFAAVVYYSVWGYKIPNGNLLRYTFILFALQTCALIVSDFLSTANQVLIDPISGKDRTGILATIFALRGFETIILAYVGGRLGKMKKNIVLLSILMVAEIVNVILYFFDGFNDKFTALNFFWNIGSCILVIDLIFVYFIRFKQHKEAGLTDK